MYDKNAKKARYLILKYDFTGTKNNPSCTPGMYNLFTYIYMLKDKF